MHRLMELKEKLIEELEEYAENGKFSKDDVEAIKYTASAIDHICNILEDKEEYSNAMGGRSYARGRGRNARRDAMGRYSRRGRSYAGDEMSDMVDEIYSIMDRLPEDAKRDAQRFVKKLEDM